MRRYNANCNTGIDPGESMDEASTRHANSSQVYQCPALRSGVRLEPGLMNWPMTTTRHQDDALRIGGISVPGLADRFGTPLYVLDETTIRTIASGFRDAFQSAYPAGSHVVYAGKALLNASVVRIIRDEGLGLDVVSGGELFAGLRAGMPAGRITFHGNNKSREELRAALDAGIGMIVIDNLHEVDLLGELLAGRPARQDVMLRLNPGVDVHTHEKISTGIVDSKFGVPITSGLGEAAVEHVLATPGLRIVGYHAHLGSQLLERDAHLEAIADMLAFAAGMHARHGVELLQFSPGGGFGIAYLETDKPPAIDSWADTIAGTVVKECERHGLPLPVLTIEPGRAIVGRAGVAVYTVGSIKRLAGLRTYVTVDGGMADNIRPTLYGASYTASRANAPDNHQHGRRERVRIAGKYCESGDILIDDIELPVLHPGDILAIPAAGAYTLAMASNYNLALRPAVVMVRDGQATMIRRRETFEDLVAFDCG